MTPGMFENKKVLVAGLGISGKAAFDALVGAGALPAVYDDRDIEADDQEFFGKLKAAGAALYLKGAAVPDEAWDFVVLSPGVPPWLPFVEKAAARGAEVIGELELSCRIGRGVYVSITGTNGKTTTTTLVGEIFNAAGLKAAVCGNIGEAVVTKALEADDETWLITETSSFQLETTRWFRPRIAAFLNLTPDHMDRHKTMDNYAAAKAKIFANQKDGDVLVYNADDARVAALAKASKAALLPFSRTKTFETGAFVKDGKLMVAVQGMAPAPLIDAGELQIPGAHNLENALAAAAVAAAAGISPKVTAGALKNFKGVEHRIEFVAEAGGVRYVNDSKGTNPDASIKAIEAIGQDFLLIAGGYDKGADFTDYIRAAKGRAAKLLLLGTTAEKIRACALAEGFGETEIFIVKGMEEAVRLAAELAEPGDTVLLSPACASWDMYKDYEERGRHFKGLVWGMRLGE